ERDRVRDRRGKRILLPGLRLPGRVFLRLQKTLPRHRVLRLEGKLAARRSRISTRMTKEPLEKWMRYALFVTGPVNFLGALIFMPPFASLRSQFTLPEPHPFYLWILSIWIFAFGCCYLYMAI